MKFRHLLLLLCLTLLLPQMAFAQEEARLVTEAHYYTASLYYCDAARNQMVLKNVKPMGKSNTQNTQTALDAEYLELPVTCDASLQDGSTVPLAECNRYVDSTVRALITRSATGALRVVSLRFL